MKPTNRAVTVFVITVLTAFVFITLFKRKERPAQ
ncbi:hypothetical protein Krac_7136 [Ktedonobacter racemifer DSM 44963]|uniref:Uncharacterized protein n=1 Tax=Ktedonobacter racemifer DSM 44963 TaxID=485913 RepID=D6TR10_KTERA|nr:hypothetical protein Krac_7136 [Ktedonobacter racemifer DSM 44963]